MVFNGSGALMAAHSINIHSKAQSASHSLIQTVSNIGASFPDIQLNLYLTGQIKQEICNLPSEIDLKWC